MQPSLGNLNVLPPELILKFLLKVDNLTDLSYWCQTSTRASVICQDEGFWHQKYLKDYRDQTPLSEGETWRERYKQMTRGGGISPISAGDEHYAIIDQNGILYTAGNNTEWQLGHSAGQPTNHPTMIPFPSKVISVACGSQFTGVVTEDGKVYGWGKTYLNQRVKPQLIRALKSRKAVKFSAGEYGYAIILDDGSVYINTTIGPYTNQKKNIKGIFSLNAIDIFMDESQVYIISKDHQLYMFGGKALVTQEGLRGLKIGLEGEGKDLKINPVHIPLPGPVQQVFANYYYVVILLRKGDVHKLDKKNGMVLPKLTLPPISRISVSRGRIAAITRDGKLYMWGESGMGEIIDNKIGLTLPNVTSRYLPQMSADYLNDLPPTPYQIITIPSPIQIDIGYLVKYVAMGRYFTIAVTSDGVVNYWGTSAWIPK